MLFRDKIHVPAVVLCAALVLACPSGGPAPSDGPAEAVIEQNILGTAYLSQFSWDPAATAFTAALAQRPDDPVLLNNLGVTRVQQNRLEEATDLFGQALTQEPSLPWAHYNLGLLAKNDGDFAAAVEHFEVVAAYDAEDLHTQYNLASVLARLDRNDEAERAFRKALASNPTHVSTLYALGQFLMQSGRQEEGIELIQRSEQIRTRHGGDTIGMQYGEQGLYATGYDYPGGALAAPAAIEVNFEPGRSIPATPQSGWTLGPKNGMAALIVPSEPGFETLGVVRGLVSVDVDNDGTADIVALVADGAAMRPLARLSDDGAWTSERFSGDGGVEGESVAVIAVDKDHDGDLDLVWCAESGCAVAVNNGAAEFSVESAANHGLTTGTLVAPIDIAFSDIDNDRDIDLLVGDAAAVRVFANQRDGTFADIGAGHGLEQAGGGPMVVVDLDKDGTMDLLLGGPAGLRQLANDRGTFKTPRTLAEGNVPGLAVTDIDNDGFLDPVFASDKGISVLHNRGAGQWARRDELFAGAASGSRPLAGWDADGDGDNDLGARGPDGAITVWTNQGGNGNRSITLTAKGVGDNVFGIGSKVEVLAGALRQKFERTRPIPLVVGLGRRDSVQSVRMLWPSGVLQDEVNLSAATAATITQLDRKGTSCPLLYAWRDGAWHFVTDFLGGAAVGYQKAPGVYGTPDTDEYVLIEGGLSESDGWLRLRLNNQLEEILWFDQAELVVVDHPDGSSVYPNERLMPAPPWPEFGLFASDDIRSVSLRDDEFELLPYKGYAQTHTLELDLGPFDARQRIVLLLDGWIDYADSSSNVAAAQAGAALTPPRLNVAAGSGRWIDASDRMGFPAGLPKTMSVDLTELFVTADHRVRIETNMRIYWERARVLIGGSDLPLDVKRLPANAELRAGGFPRPTGTRPYAYDPASFDVDGGWKAHVGAYTGFGDVSALLRSIDDAFVTTRNGDEIELRFAAPAPAPPGFTRTYLLYADGFGKDMDPNSAAADTVGPLPFHGMPSYPYGPDVLPPRRPELEQPASRYVRSAYDGLPGVLPQVLASRRDPR